MEVYAPCIDVLLYSLINTATTFMNIGIENLAKQLTRSVVNNTVASAVLLHQPSQYVTFIITDS